MDCTPTYRESTLVELILSKSESSFQLTLGAPYDELAGFRARSSRSVYRCIRLARALKRINKAISASRAAGTFLARSRN